MIKLVEIMASGIEVALKELGIVGKMTYITKSEEIKYLFCDSLEVWELSDEEFKNKHIAYNDLHMTLCHNAIFQARKLYESKLRDGLTDEEWYTLKSFREEVTHARDLESKEIKKIGDINTDLIPLLNKISQSIYAKYKLENDEKYQKFVKLYFEDLNKL